MLGNLGPGRLRRFVRYRLVNFETCLKLLTLFLLLRRIAEVRRLKAIKWRMVPPLTKKIKFFENEHLWANRSQFPLILHWTGVYFYQLTSSARALFHIQFLGRKLK